MVEKTLTGIITWLKNWFYDKTEIDSELSKKKSHYYGTCTTSASTQVKAVTSTDFVLNTGVVLSVKFTNNNTYNGTAKLKINDSEDEINVATVGTTTTSRYYWKAGEVVTFIYDGTNFIMAEGGNATTTYYGVTKLSSSTSSTSEVLSATPKAVKTAYDLANGKQDALVSGTNIKTINNTSLLGSGNIDISGGGSSVDVVTSWEATLSDSKVPSEKLVKNSLDSKSESNHTHNIWNLAQDTSSGVYALQDEGDGYCNLFGKLFYSYPDDSLYYNTYDANSELATKNDIPSLTNYVQKSQTTGLIKNDGTIMQSGTGASNFALGNHTHSGYANSSHTHTKSQITDFPTIPSKTSDLTNDGADGTNVFVSNNDSRLSDNRNPLLNPLSATSTNHLDLNDVTNTGFYALLGNTSIQYVSNLPSSWGATSFYLFTLQFNGTYIIQFIVSYDYAKSYVRVKMGNGWNAWRSYLSSDNVVDNLTSTSSTSVLSARQGKVLKDSLVWQTQALTNMTGCTLYYNDLFCVLEVNGSYTINTKNAYKALVSGTIPSEFCPSGEIVEINNGTVFIRVKVTEDGALQYISPQTFTSNAGIRVEFIWKR